MSSKAETQGEARRLNPGSGGLELFKWFAALIILGAGLYGYYYFEEIPAVYRGLALFPVVLAVLGIVALTSQGASFWGLMKDAVVEIKRVIWPTRQETTQTTLVVFGVVFVMSFVLWGLDALFAQLVSYFVG